MGDAPGVSNRRRGNADDPGAGACGRGSPSQRRCSSTSRFHATPESRRPGAGVFRVNARLQHRLSNLARVSARLPVAAECASVRLTAAVAVLVGRDATHLPVAPRSAHDRRCLYPTLPHSRTLSHLASPVLAYRAFRSGSAAGRSGSQWPVLRGRRGDFGVESARGRWRSRLSSRSSGR